ncbi:MAG: flagellar hook basal-body protein, partial [Deltaproteobacteria bacterium]|nr:flagellar hook basal-body protein [Deltaproteobacteria bacterium]
MHSDIFIAATGLMAQEKRLEVIANNLANANTTGFKRDVASFGTWLDIQLRGGLDGRAEAVGGVSADTSDLHGTFMYRTVTDFSQGALRYTGNPLDFALQGEGFFVLQTPEGIRYTRNGSFQIGADNYLITRQGYRVMGEAGAIQIIGEELQCDTKGRLRSAGRDIDRLKIVKSPDP